MCRQCQRLGDTCVYDPYPNTANSDSGNKRRKTSPEREGDANITSTHPPLGMQVDADAMRSWTNASVRPRPPSLTPGQTCGLQQPSPNDIIPDHAPSNAYPTPRLDPSFFNDEDGLFSSHTKSSLDSYLVSSSSLSQSSPARDDFSGARTSSATSLTDISLDLSVIESGWRSGRELTPSVLDGINMVGKSSVGDASYSGESTESATSQQISEKQDGFKLPVCLSTPQGTMRRYVGSPFWALAGNRVSRRIK